MRRKSLLCVKNRLLSLNRTFKYSSCVYTQKVWKIINGQLWTNFLHKFNYTTNSINENNYRCGAYGSITCVHWTEKKCLLLNQRWPVRAPPLICFATLRIFSTFTRKKISTNKLTPIVQLQCCSPTCSEYAKQISAQSGNPSVGKPRNTWANLRFWQIIPFLFSPTWLHSVCSLLLGIWNLVCSIVMGPIQRIMDAPSEILFLWTLSGTQNEKMVKNRRFFRLFWS